MLILVQEENKQGRVNLIQYTSFEKSQIHQITIMYHFKYTNHDILVNFTFKNL